MNYSHSRNLLMLQRALLRSRRTHTAAELVASTGLSRCTVYRCLQIVETSSGLPIVVDDRMGLNGRPCLSWGIDWRALAPRDVAMGGAA